MACNEGSLITQEMLSWCNSKFDSHLALHDHAGKPVGDGRINQFKFFLLLEGFGGVAQHEVADGAVEVVRRLARVEGNCFLMKSQGLLRSSGFGERYGKSIVGKRVTGITLNQTSKYEFRVAEVTHAIITDGLVVFCFW